MAPDDDINPPDEATPDYQNSDWAQQLREQLAINDLHIDEARLEDGFDLVRERGAIILEAISSFYREVISNYRPRGAFVVLALGGTGRGEICPASDVDTGVIVENYEENEGFRRYLGQQIVAIKPIIPELGSAKLNGMPDLTNTEHFDFASLLSLLDGHLLAGDPQFAERVRQECHQRAAELGVEFIFFVRQQLAEMDQWYPNIPGNVGSFHTKKGKGGLRNFQLSMWLYAFERWLPSVRVYEQSLATRRFDSDGAPPKAVIDAVSVIFAARCWIERLRQQQRKSGAEAKRPDTVIEAEDMRSFVNRFGTSGLLELNHARATILAYRREAVDRLLEQGVVVPQTDGLVVMGQNGLHLRPDSLFRDPTEVFFSLYTARQQLQLPIDESVKRAARKNAADTVMVAPQFVALMSGPGEIYTTLCDWVEYRLLAKFIPGFGALANQLYSLHHRSATFTRETRALQRIKNLEHLLSVSLNEGSEEDEVFFARQLRDIGSQEIAAVRLALLTEEIPQSLYDPDSTHFSDETYRVWARRYLDNQLSMVPAMTPGMLRTIEFCMLMKRISLRDADVSAQPAVLDAWLSGLPDVEQSVAADMIRALALFLYAAFDFRKPDNVAEPRLNPEQWTNVRSLMQNLLFRLLRIDGTNINSSYHGPVGQVIADNLPHRLLASPHLNRSVRTNYEGIESLDPHRASHIINKLTEVVQSGRPIVIATPIKNYFRVYVYTWDSPGLFWRITELLYQQGCRIRTTDLYSIPYPEATNHSDSSTDELPRHLIYDVISFDAPHDARWLSELRSKLRQRLEHPHEVRPDDTQEILNPIRESLEPKLTDLEYDLVKFSCHLLPDHLGTHYAITRLLSEKAKANIVSIADDGTHDWRVPRINFYIHTPLSMDEAAAALEPFVGPIKLVKSSNDNHDSDSTNGTGNTKLVDRSHSESWRTGIGGIEDAKSDVRTLLEYCTWETYETEFHDRHLLHNVIHKWARERPNHPALIDAETNETISYAQLEHRIHVTAVQLVSMGLQRGDYFATMLPLTPDHIVLEYACFKAGIVHVPLDLRLKAPEVVRSIQLVDAKAFATLGKTPIADFNEIVDEVEHHCKTVNHLVQCGPPEQLREGTVCFAEVFAAGQTAATENFLAVEELGRRLESARPTDGAQVIYTTGSTGYPKPALLSHRNITVQNMCLARGFGLESSKRMLVNLPPSHVGCQAEQLMTTLFHGQTCVILHLFDAEKSLRAIQNYDVDSFGQVPAMFNLQYRLPNYDSFSLGSVRRVLFGGQQVSREFVRQLLHHYPMIGTGLGLSEMAGFVTYTGMTSNPEGLESTVGWWAPITPLSIRAPMQPDGSAGEELPHGEVGEICFAGPQVFISYVNDEDAYRKTVSREGICYTGDLGCVTESGLQFRGRSKLVIKPKGYQVHPGQIEDHFSELRELVANCGAVGAPHAVYSEAIVLFVERQPKCNATDDEIRQRLEQHAGGIAAYARPMHYVFLSAGNFPLNRIAKTDYVRLRELALEEIKRLQYEHQWDTV